MPYTFKTLKKAYTVDSLYLEHPLSRTSLYLELKSRPLCVSCNLFFSLYLELSLSRTNFLVPCKFEIERFNCSYSRNIKSNAPAKHSQDTTGDSSVNVKLCDSIMKSPPDNHPHIYIYLFKVGEPVQHFCIFNILINSRNPPYVLTPIQ